MFITEPITLIQPNTTRVYFDSIDYLYMYATWLQLVLYILCFNIIKIDKTDKGNNGK